MFNKGDIKKLGLSEDKIKFNEPMSKHTSFKTGGIAECYIIATTIGEVQKVFKFSKENNIPLYIIGNGSNLLVSDDGVKGIILKMNLENISLQEQENEIIAKVESGTKLMGFAYKLKEQGITGFEELSGIPGTMGGANMMNAGAYGKELKDILIETKCLDENGNILTLKKEEQNLEYRSSIFKNKKYIILETTIKLQKGNKDDINKKMNEYAMKRKEKQPTEYPSAGSTFKRKEGVITAKLIDECGLKGYSIGGAQISEKHAGFIINKGNATSKDILELIEYTKKKIYEKFKINIEEEIEIIGENIEKRKDN